MKGDLFFYDKQAKTWEDAYEQYGVTLCGGTLESLLTPAPMKSYITNTSRLEHGIHVAGTSRVDKRDVTVTVSIEGATASQCIARQKAFATLIQSGEVIMKIGNANLGDEVFHLYYTSSSSYSTGISRTICKMAIKFSEPNPKNRTL